MQNTLKLFSLKTYNTFGIQVYCNEFIDITDETQIIEFINKNKDRKSNFLIIGSGSNILFTENFDGTILKNSLNGISLISEDENEVIIKIASGEVWSEIVNYCVEKDWGGIENLSLIPGTAGAAPVQNIGAYGVELKDVLLKVEAIDMLSGEKISLSNESCKFGYRNSIFKDEYKGKCFIVSITIKLNKNSQLNTSYGDISRVLKEIGIINPSIKDVSNAVIQIRKSKLPDPAITGNAGSFFKNPVIDISFFKKLKEKFPDIKSFPDESNKMKIAAAWLIENSGLKGYNNGNAAIHDKQPLVIINKGNATGNEIKDLADFVIKTVNEKFGIVLTPEVNIL